MAFTVGTLYKTVVGDLKTHILSCSVDSASGNITTGLSVIYGFSVAPVSCVTALPNFKMNTGSGATARAGILNINSANTTDSFQVIVYGK